MKGLEKLWLIGDEFAFRTFHQYFKEQKTSDHKPDMYTFMNYEVKEYLTTRRDALNRSVISRIWNSLVNAFNEHEQLPKVIVVVLDDDVVKYVKTTNPEATALVIDRITQWLIREFDRSIFTAKYFLPQKAKKADEPHVLWIAPGTHKYFGDLNNKKRIYQTDSLESFVKVKENMTILKMIKFWDHEDSSFFIYDSYRFTAQGLKNYWLAIDSAIRFWSVAIAPKLKFKNKKKFATKRFHTFRKWRS